MIVSDRNLWLWKGKGYRNVKVTMCREREREKDRKTERRGDDNERPRERKWCSVGELCPVDVLPHCRALPHPPYLDSGQAFSCVPRRPRPVLNHCKMFPKKSSARKRQRQLEQWGGTHKDMMYGNLWLMEYDNLIWSPVRLGAKECLLHLRFDWITDRIAPLAVFAVSYQTLLFKAYQQHPDNILCLYAWLFTDRRPSVACRAHW